MINKGSKWLGKYGSSNQREQGIDGTPNNPLDEIEDEIANKHGGVMGSSYNVDGTITITAVDGTIHIVTID